MGPDCLELQVKSRLATLPLGLVLQKGYNWPNLSFTISFSNGSHKGQVSPDTTESSFDATADLKFERLESFRMPSETVITSVVYDDQIIKHINIHNQQHYSNDLIAPVDRIATETSFGLSEQPLPSIPRPHSPFPSPNLRKKVKNIIESRQMRLEGSQSASKKEGKRPILSPLAVSTLDSEYKGESTGVPRKKLELHSATFRNFKDIIGPFIGKYEESLLNGRLSTSPSKALQFTCEIGAFGMGKCKPSLKCPRHLVTPFNVVFYQLSDVEIPTPYVGIVEFPVSDPEVPLELGCYRLPLKGQLQIVFFT